MDQTKTMQKEKYVDGAEKLTKNHQNLDSKSYLCYAMCNYYIYILREEIEHKTILQ